MLYGCGLRVSEPLNLRIKDINLERGRLVIRGAKGGKDRMVVLPASLVPELKQQIQRARGTWQIDRQNRTPVTLPGCLAKKYPEFQFAWSWAWLFPAHHACRDPRSGKPQGGDCIAAAAAAVAGVLAFAGAGVAGAHVAAGGGANAGLESRKQVGFSKMFVVL
jgi:integrase